MLNFIGSYLHNFLILPSFRYSSFQKEVYVDADPFSKIV